MQICHYAKLFLLGPNCVIIRLFLSFNIYFSVHQFSRHISKSKKKCFRENSWKTSSRLWLSAMNFHGKYNLQ